MTTYQPYDLREWCNVDADWLGEDIDLPLGEQNFRGLPFLIASDKQRHSFLGFGEGGYKEPVEIELAAQAKWVIVAHRLLDSHILEGEEVGKHIASYQLHYHDGSKEEVPIRERFEIAKLPVGFGQLAMLAMPDVLDEMMPWEAGSWEQVGQRQIEFRSTWPRHFYLWAWKNPYPDREVRCLRIEPKDRRFLIAALTISVVEEEPFGRQPATPVKIILKDSEIANQPFNISVSVDRGVATYAYPLPLGGIGTREGF